MLQRYLQCDAQVAAKFFPNKVLLRRMNLGRFVLSQEKSECIPALQLASHLLKSHIEVDYGDFSEEALVI